MTYAALYIVGGLIFARWLYAAYGVYTMENHTAEIMRHKERLIRLNDEIRILRDENARLKESCEQWQELARSYARTVERMREEQVKRTGAALAGEEG